MSKLAVQLLHDYYRSCDERDRRNHAEWLANKQIRDQQKSIQMGLVKNAALEDARNGYEKNARRLLNRYRTLNAYLPFVRHQRIKVDEAQRTIDLFGAFTSFKFNMSGDQNNAIYYRPEDTPKVCKPEVNFRYVHQQLVDVLTAYASVVKPNGSFTPISEEMVFNMLADCINLIYTQQHVYDQLRTLYSELSSSDLDNLLKGVAVECNYSSGLVDIFSTANNDDDNTKRLIFKLIGNLPAGEYSLRVKEELAQQGLYGFIKLLVDSEELDTDFVMSYSLPPYAKVICLAIHYLISEFAKIGLDFIVNMSRELTPHPLLETALNDAPRTVFHEEIHVKPIYDPKAKEVNQALYRATHGVFSRAFRALTGRPVCELHVSEYHCTEETYSYVGDQLQRVLRETETYQKLWLPTLPETCYISRTVNRENELPKPSAVFHIGEVIERPILLTEKELDEQSLQSQAVSELSESPSCKVLFERMSSVKYFIVPKSASEDLVSFTKALERYVATHTQRNYEDEISMDTHSEFIDNVAEQIPGLFNNTACARDLNASPDNSIENVVQKYSEYFPKNAEQKLNQRILCEYTELYNALNSYSEPRKHEKKQETLGQLWVNTKRLYREISNIFDIHQVASPAIYHALFLATVARVEIDWLGSIDYSTRYTGLDKVGNDIYLDDIFSDFETAKREVFAEYEKGRFSFDAFMNIVDSESYESLSTICKISTPIQYFSFRYFEIRRSHSTAQLSMKKEVESALLLVNHGKFIEKHELTQSEYGANYIQFLNQSYARIQKVM